MHAGALSANSQSSFGGFARGGLIKTSAGAEKVVLVSAAFKATAVQADQGRGGKGHGRGGRGGPGAERPR